MEFLQVWPSFKEESGVVLVNVKPLQALPDGDATWGTLITFDPMQLYEACGVPASDAYAMHESCCYGLGSLKELDKPINPCRAGEVCEHGAILEFDRTLPELIPWTHL